MGNCGMPGLEPPGRNRTVHQRRRRSGKCWHRSAAGAPTWTSVFSGARCARGSHGRLRSLFGTGRGASAISHRCHKGVGGRAEPVLAGVLARGAGLQVGPAHMGSCRDSQAANLASPVAPFTIRLTVLLKPCSSSGPGYLSSQGSLPPDRTSAYRRAARWRLSPRSCLPSSSLAILSPTEVISSSESCSALPSVRSIAIGR